MVRTPRAGLGLLALFLALMVGFATTACTSSEESSPATTEASAEVPAEAPAEAPVAVDTPPGPDAPCTADALALAGSASGPEANYDTVDSFGCDGGYAWAWLTDSSSGTAPPISELFIDTGEGSWSLLPPNEYCGQPGTGLPDDVLAKGCEYTGNGDGNGATD